MSTPSSSPCIHLFINQTEHLAASSHIEVRSLEDRIQAHRALGIEIVTEQIHLRGFERASDHDLGGTTAYNPTVFRTHIQGSPTEVLAARIESLRGELDTETRFFKRSRDGVYAEVPGAPVFPLQDPFSSRVRGELILGGVRAFEVSPGDISYETVFYRDHGKGLMGIDPNQVFARGPSRMKDLRLVDMGSDGILLFTRPQGGPNGEYGPGVVGVTKIKSLEELKDEKTYWRAKILENLWPKNEWGAINEGFYLPQYKRVVLLGHMAKWANTARTDRTYVPVLILYDPATGHYGAPVVLAERSQFQGGLEGGSKRYDLRDVLFSGHIEILPNGDVVLWVGAGDFRIDRAVIPRALQRLGLIVP